MMLAPAAIQACATSAWRVSIETGSGSLGESPDDRTHAGELG